MHSYVSSLPWLFLYGVVLSPVFICVHLWFKLNRSGFGEGRGEVALALREGLFTRKVEEPLNYVYCTIAPAGQTRLVRDQPGRLFRVPGLGEEPVAGRIG